MSTFSSTWLHVSDWTVAEFASLLALRVRIGDDHVEFALETMRLFRSDVGSSLILHSLDRKLLDAAAELGVMATDGNVLGSG